MSKYWSVLILLIVIILLHGCAATGKLGKGGYNIFSIEDDIALGKELAVQVADDPKNYPILDENRYRAAYNYLYAIRDKILNSGKVKHKDDFEWSVKIIQNDTILNAFAAPGGYIYVYTGLIKYLDSEDELAGVLGHEIAHADRRHSTNQLSKQYSIAAAVDVFLGDYQNVITQLAEGLLYLRFSRAHESEADQFSVIYLCETGYNAAGAAGFFEKIQGEPVPPQWLSTHPSPSNRVESITKYETDLNCKGTGTFKNRYQDLKRSLP